MSAWCTYRGRAIRLCHISVCQGAGLDDGVKRLGHVPPLELRAVELELCRNCPDAALDRLNEQIARDWSIRIKVQRDERLVFAGETSVGKMKRNFAELAEFLYRSQVFPYGAILLTGTGIVPASRTDFFSMPAGAGIFRGTAQ